MTVDNESRSSISILLVTYNHEKYIEKAIQSIYAQILDQEIELVIADDNSNDNTLEIIKSYEHKDARFSFKYIDNAKNVGITKNYERGISACTGEYVAVLEGDDFWVSPLKLKQQYDFLRAHMECDLCAVNYFVYDEDRHQFSLRIPESSGHRYFGARDLIADNVVGNFSVCMYRRSALLNLPPNLFDICSYDWIINICVARTSLIGFLQEPMSVYRVHSDGAWSFLANIDKIKKQLALVPQYDELTGRIFHDEFSSLTTRLESLINEDQVAQVAAPILDPLSRSAPRLIDIMPPILITIFRLVLPPILKRFLIRKI